MPQSQRPIRSGYAIFCPTFFQGIMPVCYQDNHPLVFATKAEARREIADNQLARIRQFLDGERDFDGAITTGEFVLLVQVWPDGTISTEDGRFFGKQDA